MKVSSWGFPWAVGDGVEGLHSLVEGSMKALGRGLLPFFSPPTPRRPHFKPSRGMGERSQALELDIGKALRALDFTKASSPYNLGGNWLG